MATFLQKFKSSDRPFVHGSTNLFSLVMNKRVFGEIDERFKKIKKVENQNKVLVKAAQAIIDEGAEYAPYKTDYPLRSKRTIIRHENKPVAQGGNNFSKLFKRHLSNTSKQNSRKKPKVIDTYRQNVALNDDGTPAISRRKVGERDVFRYTYNNNKPSLDVNISKESQRLETKLAEANQELNQMRSKKRAAIKSAIASEKQYVIHHPETRRYKDKVANLRLLYYKGGLTRKQYHKQMEHHRIAHVPLENTLRMHKDATLKSVNDEYAGKLHDLAESKKSLTKAVKKSYNKNPTADRPPHLKASYELISPYYGQVGIRYYVRKKKDDRFKHNSKYDLQEYSGTQYYTPDQNWKRATPNTGARWFEQALGIDIPMSGYKKIDTDPKENYANVIKAYKDALTEQLKKH